MINREKLISACDGLELNVTELVPDSGKPVGILQISHGMSEHSKRYVPFMEFMCRQGYVCVIHDHRGHGESLKKKEDLGYFYDVTGEYIVEDLHQVTLYIKKKYPGLPLILFGHSMGSLVARCYIKRYDGELKKLILCGAPCGNPLVNAGIFLTRALYKIKGGDYRSQMIHKLAMGAYSRRFPNEGPNGWICSDKSQIEKYELDEESGFMFTVNGYQNLFLLLKKTFSKKGWQMENPKMPILFIAGEEDPVIGGKKKFQDSIMFLRKRGYQEIGSRLYEGKRHELLNEDIRARVYQDVADWIGQ